MKQNLVNVYLNLEHGSNHITVDGYKIYPQPSNTLNKNNYKKHQKNAWVEFEGNQNDSILYAGGFLLTPHNNKKRKFIDDILTIGSILNGWNWGLHSRRNSPSFQITPKPYLEDIFLHNVAIENSLQNALNKIKESSWQTQYENGFHLRMLLNHSNITNTESRFLSNVVIWEWLYPHLKNPNGASQIDESDDLKTILDYILEYFFKNRKTFKGNIIFQALRNQLAHSGKLPINRDRKYADQWMKELEWDPLNSSQIGIKDYLIFFENLTQVIILKTLDINAEEIIRGNDLNSFLTNGSLPP